MSAVFSVYNQSVYYAGEQGTYWDNTNKELTSFKMAIFLRFCCPSTSLVLQYGNFVPREQLAVNSLFMGQISAKICCREAFSSQMWPTPPPTPQATLKAIYDNQKLQESRIFHHFPKAFCPGLEVFNTLRAEPHWVRRRKGGSAWITSNLWGRRSPNFWTGQSCFFLSN